MKCWAILNEEDIQLELLQTCNKFSDRQIYQVRLQFLIELYIYN